MSKTAIILSILTLTAAPALADQAPAEHTTPDKAAALHRMVGTHKLKGTFTMGGQTSKLTGTIACAKTSGDAGVLCNTTFTGIPGIDRYEETDLFGYDAGDGLYHWFAVTNGGETHDHKGTAAGDKWVFQHTGPQDGALLTERVVLTWKGDRLKSFRSTITVGDDQIGVFEGKVVK